MNYIISIDGIYNSRLCQTMFGTIRMRPIVVQSNDMQSAYKRFDQYSKTLSPPNNCRWVKFKISIEQIEIFQGI